ncbi:MAG: CBS domain-containing protein [Planctomycetota bacterium]
MDTLVEILSAKPRGVISTPAGVSVREATRLMNEHAIGSLLVTAGSRLVGIFTERDVLRRVVADGRSPDATTVGEVMTRDVVCCPPEAAVEDVAELMRCRRVRHVPVVDHDEAIVGLVSIGDINAHRFAACATELVQVRDYILGRT